MLLRALNLDPGHATSLFNLADLYRWRLNGIDIAIRVFQNALKSKNLRDHLAKYVVIHN